MRAGMRSPAMRITLFLCSVAYISIKLDLCIREKVIVLGVGMLCIVQEGSFWTILCMGQQTF